MDLANSGRVYTPRHGYEEIEEPEGDTRGSGDRVGGKQGASEQERPAENVSCFQREERYSLRNSELRQTGWISGCIGVLIPALNYPLSWAQLGPLVKTPPLFVLRSR